MYCAIVIWIGDGVCICIVYWRERNLANQSFSSIIESRKTSSRQTSLLRFKLGNIKIIYIILKKIDFFDFLNWKNWIKIGFGSINRSEQAQGSQRWTTRGLHFEFSGGMLTDVWECFCEICLKKEQRTLICAVSPAATAAFFFLPSPHIVSSLSSSFLLLSKRKFCLSFFYLFFSIVIINNVRS